MINGNNSSIFRFFLIFSMNFAWIGNVFGFISSKKDALSVKRVSKSANRTDFIKNKQVLQVYQFQKLNTADLSAVVLNVATQQATIAICYRDTFPLRNYPQSGIKKEILFPHHGFW